MPEPRSVLSCTLASCVLAIALAVAACSPPSSAGQPPPDSEGEADGAAASDARGAGLDARGGPDGSSSRRDAAIDAAPGRDAAADASPLPVDASAPGSDASTPGGTVSCYTTANPSATCTLPVHCCFTNYSSAHDGSCTTAACTWGTISCDGPEDCPGGQRCCAHVLVDPEIGITGYTLACQSTACGAAPANQELCHPTDSPSGTCSSGSCVSALGADTDLPRSLYVCQ